MNIALSVATVVLSGLAAFVVGSRWAAL